jgi:hypothetical protein
VTTDRYGKPRALSLPELAGWRRFWDGWVICPPCMAGRGFIGGPYTPASWQVPAHYDTPIKTTDTCSRCRESFDARAAAAPVVLPILGCGNDPRPTTERTA